MLEAPWPGVQAGAAEREAAAQRQENQQNREEDHGKTEEVRGPGKNQAWLEDMLSSLYLYM